MIPHPPTEPPDEPLSRTEAATWSAKLSGWADELDGAPDELGNDVYRLQEMLDGMASKLERITEKGKRR